MKKWNMIVDVARCNNCYNCFVATKDEYVDNDHPGYAAPQPLHDHNWVDIERKEAGQWPMVQAHFRPVMCNHCDDAPCMKAATDGAIKKRDDGIVIIDPERAKGQKQIVDACPYGAVYWNEERQIPQAWPFDAHLLDRGWEKTKIEKVCPTGALRSLKVTDEDMQKLAADDQLETLEPRDGAKPRVYYRNAHLFNAAFIGGTIVTEADGREDCVEGVTIIALHDGQEIGRAVSDAFGEFRIEQLEEGLGKVALKIESGSTSLTLDVDLEQSVYVGCISII
jgi:Fe-S-cluster-containing dehydrogenase component